MQLPCDMITFHSLIWKLPIIRLCIQNVRENPSPKVQRSCWMTTSRMLSIVCFLEKKMDSSAYFLFCFGQAAANLVKTGPDSPCFPCTRPRGWEKYIFRARDGEKQPKAASKLLLNWIRHTSATFLQAISENWQLFKLSSHTMTR